jgi:outer membrane protein
MKKFFIFLTVVASLSVPFSSYAVELSLDDCIKLTFENNPSLKAQLNDLEAAKYSYLTSLNSYLPKVNLSHSFSKSGGDGRDTSNNFSLSASVSQNIFDYSSISNIRTSKLSYEIQQINYENYLVSLRQDLYNAFFTLLFAQEYVKVNENIVNIRKNNADLITLKYQSGFESKGDMLYAVAQYEMSKLNLSKAKRQMRISSNNLKSIMGVSMNDDITLKYAINIDSNPIELSDIESYVRSNPKYKNYQKSIMLAEEKLRNSKNEWLPKLTFSASDGLSGKSEFPDNNLWSVGLSLSMPIFSSGVTYHKNNKSMLEESLKSTQEELNAYVITLSNSIKSSYEEYINSIDTANTYKVLLAANEERYKEAEVKYKAGKMSYIDLENIEQNLIDSNQNYNNYLQNVYLKKVAFESLLNKKLSKIEER